MFFFFNDTATTEIYTLSLHDALPICLAFKLGPMLTHGAMHALELCGSAAQKERYLPKMIRDRKSTRLNSSHLVISYAVFCLKKKKKNDNSLILGSHRLADAHVTRRRL